MKTRQSEDNAGVVVCHIVENDDKPVADLFWNNKRLHFKASEGTILFSVSPSPRGGGEPIRPHSKSANVLLFAAHAFQPSLFSVTVGGRSNRAARS